MSRTQRVRIDVAYDGSEFHGWARQPGLRTVEGELGSALSTILRRPVPLTVAGRTDAGVHARGQVAHFDMTPTEMTDVEVVGLPQRIQGLMNRSFAAIRPAEARSGVSDVVIKAVRPVQLSFDARFSATQRHYCYRLADADGPHDPLRRTNVWWQPQARLHTPHMQEAATQLIGEHDYLSFCRPREGATTIRELQEFSVQRNVEGIIEFHVRADAFCHSMVRTLVGAMVEVGRGKRNLHWVAAVLEHPSRQHGVPVVPARGLTLEAVRYPSPQLWAERASQAKTRRELTSTVKPRGRSATETSSEV